MYWLASILVLAGTLLLCFSMQKHFRALFAPKFNSTNIRKSMRAAGYVCLLVALYAASQVDDFGIALTTIFGMFTVTHLGIALYLGRLEASFQSKR